jgi:hypothetical protein
MDRLQRSRSHRRSRDSLRWLHCAMDRLPNVMSSSTATGIWLRVAGRNDASGERAKTALTASFQWTDVSPLRVPERQLNRPGRPPPSLVADRLLR